MLAECTKVEEDAIDKVPDFSHFDKLDVDTGLLFALKSGPIWTKSSQALNRPSRRSKTV